MASIPNKMPKGIGAAAHKIQRNLNANPEICREHLMNNRTDKGLQINVDRKKPVSITFPIHDGKASKEPFAKADPAISMIHPGSDNITAARFACLGFETVGAIT